MKNESEVINTKENMNGEGSLKFYKLIKDLGNSYLVIHCEHIKIKFCRSKMFYPYKRLS